jgi:hypothetical protein
MIRDVPGVSPLSLGHVLYGDRRSAAGLPLLPTVLLYLFALRPFDLEFPSYP